MPIHHSIWRVDQKPQALKEGQLVSESLLEDMIVAAPEILSPEWMIIGRQEDTGLPASTIHRLLGVDASGGAVIQIELK